MIKFLMLYGIAGFLWMVWATFYQLRHNPYATRSWLILTACVNLLLWPICVIWAATRSPDQLAKICNGKFLTSTQVYDVRTGILVAKGRIDEHGAIEGCKQAVYEAYKILGMEIKEDDHWLKSRQDWDKEHENDLPGFIGD